MNGNKKSEILVSVVIITYNQGQYIRQAIESVLMQKVDFAYELILSDDCSPDETPHIIREYTKKHPFIVSVLHKQNLGASQNYMQAVLRAGGEYVVAFEGDDYWIDENKLQKQVRFLRQNPDYIAVSHVLAMRDDTGAQTGLAPSSPKIVGKDANIKSFLHGTTFSCMATMYRNFFKDTSTQKAYIDYVTRHRMVADFALCMLFLHTGKVKVLPEVLSVYRVSTADSINTSSYNASHSNLQKYQNHLDVIGYSQDFWKERYSFTGRYIHDSLFPLIESLRGKYVKAFLRVFQTIPAKVQLLFWLGLPFRCLGIVLGKLFRKGT